MVLQNSGKYKADRGQSGSEPGSGKEDSAEKRLQRSLANDEIDIQADILDEDKRLVSAVDYYLLRRMVKGHFTVPTLFSVSYQARYSKRSGLLPNKAFLGEDKKCGSHPEGRSGFTKDLLGLKQLYLRLSFLSVEDLTKVKREINPAVRKNKEREKSSEAYTTMLSKIFTFDDNERVRNQLTTKDKAIRLVELLLRKPHSGAFETFCDCLDETRQSHLASALRKEKASLNQYQKVRAKKGNTMNVDVETLQKRLSEKLSGVGLINEESLSENKK
ncbi:hypothetical protein ScPMuIL_002465 [Solemya velum]